jgi:hypothetical protein
VSLLSLLLILVFDEVDDKLDDDDDDAACDCGANREAAARLRVVLFLSITNTGGSGAGTFDIVLVSEEDDDVDADVPDDGNSGTLTAGAVIAVGAIIGEVCNASFAADNALFIALMSSSSNMAADVAVADVFDDVTVLSSIITLHNNKCICGSTDE